MHFKFFLFIIIINLIACTKEYTAELNYLKEPVLVIEAFINDIELPPNSYYFYNVYKHPVFDKNIKQEYHSNPSVWENFESYVKLRLSKSIYTNEGDDSTLITNAIVVLKDDLGNMDTLRVPKDPKFIKSNNRYYESSVFKLQKLKPIAGRKYFLEVYYNNKKYVAQSEILSTPPIDSIVLNSIKIESNAYNSTTNQYQPLVYLKNQSTNFYYLFKQVKTRNSNFYIGNNFTYSWLTNVISVGNKNTQILDGYGVNSEGGRNANYLYISQGLNGRDGLAISLNYTSGSNLFYTYNNIYLGDKYGNKNITLEDNIQIYYGSIDAAGYTYFNGLNKLFKNDAGTFSPSPNTPASNFSNGALGYFYCSSGYAYEILIPRINNKLIGVNGSFKLATILKNGEHIFSENSDIFGVVLPAIRTF